MFELKGKYNSAIVYADIVEDAAIEQAKNMLDQSFTEGETIRFMPDMHAGTGCTIGTTMTLHNKKICPNLVGVDIGCAMYVIKLSEKDIDYQVLDNIIYQYIPSGMNIRDTIHPIAVDFQLSSLLCCKNLDADYIMRSLGTLGGGNHFIECNKDSVGNLYLVIHSGSRNLGVQVAKYYQTLAIRAVNKGTRRGASKKIISELTAMGRKTEIQKALQNLNVECVPDALAYCEGQLADDYLHDMAIVQKYAMLNREIMAHEIIRTMNLHVVESFTTMHNYIDIEHMILRKGSVSARKGEQLLIPINMRDGSLLCIGKGNDHWNQSAPHGAGRLMSRSEAKATLSMNEFDKEMKGIYTTSVCQSTLDESPMAYKPMKSIINAIRDTVDIVDVLKPTYNFKASDDITAPWLKK